MVNFGQAERDIQHHFVIGQFVTFQNQKYKIEKVGKPKCPRRRGEPKTDVYILLKNTNKEIELKISYKKGNADFLENKISAERAEQILGDDWKLIIENITRQLAKEFETKSLIYKTGRYTGSITLGWKFEFVNKENGMLSEKILLTPEQCFEVYSGTKLSDVKRNATVNGEKILNSGVANYILQGDKFSSAQDVLEHIEPLEEYVARCPEVYFACKALNYRTFVNKFDGDRPLAVQVDWNIDNGKLIPKLVFNQPLQWNGRAVKDKLVESLKRLGIRTTDDISEKNAEINCIY